MCIYGLGGKLVLRMQHYKVTFALGQIRYDSDTGFVTEGLKIGNFGDFPPFIQTNFTALAQEIR